mmetsp:Transcript_6441/g.25791  ORF Transcript_6441/g.25791 Transcript_6441/m.25791 type:complete len:1211 (-) Transcript_6441:2827-6459(-)
MVTHPADVTVDEAKLTKVFKTQTEAYFAWASYGNLTLNVSVFFHQLNSNEKDDDGACNPHPDASAVDGVGYSPWHASADFEEVYNSYAGDPGTNRNSGRKHMRTFMHLTNTCTGTCESNTNGIICTQPYSSVTACADADSTTELCDTTEIHELLHAIGLKYHSGGYKCKQSDYDDSTTTWRLCEYKDYGGVFDVLGSGSDTYGKKMAWGVSSYLRWDMHWLSNDNVKVITKTNGRVDDGADDVSEPCILSSLSVDTTESSTTRACVVRFSDDTMSDLGTIWLELRSGNKFDNLIVTGEHSGFNSLGVLGYHEGNKLIDFYPHAADSTDAAKYDDWEQTALRSTENGGVWIDSVSGLKLTVAAFDSSSQTITVTVTFGQPAECSKRGAKAYPSQFLGYWVWHVRMSNDAEQAKYYPSANLADYPGSASSITDSNFENNYFTTSYFTPYIPYAEYGIQYTVQQKECYKVVLQYRMSVQNLDYGACAKSHLTVRGLNLPAGWRVDEGGCVNAAGAQAVVDDICFVVAVDPNTADGAYEIRIQAAQINYSDKAVMAATETVPLWVCVGGYNHYTQAWGDNAWTCDYGPVGSKTRVTGSSGTIINRASSTYEASSTYYSTSDVSARKSSTAIHYTRNPEVTQSGADRLQSMSSIAIAGVSDDRCYQVASTRYCSANHYVWSQYVCSACPTDSTRPEGDDSWLADGETQCSCPSGSAWSNGRCLCSAGGGYHEPPDSCCAGYYLSGSTCIACSAGFATCTSASAGTCAANYRVNSVGACEACPSGSTNAAGDNPSGSETQCDCNAGYSYFDGACVANCDASAAPANGGVGDCTSSLASGSTCQPTCNSGYTVSGSSSCTAGTLTAATCSANACDASVAPANGGVGDCTSSLASGSTCQPTCNSGYTVSGPSSCTAGTLTAATCGCANGYSLLNGDCVESTEVEVKVEFAGITQVIDDTLVQTLQNALTTSLLAGTTGVQVDPANITIKYTMLGKQTFSSPVDESSFITAAASSLGVATSDIENFAQSAARRRLLSNVVTYQVVTTNRATLNTALSAASSPITVGGVTGTGAAPTTTIAAEIKTAIPTSQASTVSATLNDPSFTTDIETSASNAGVSGISISSPPCTGLTQPANGVSGTCGSELASGSSCQPTCNSGYTVSGQTTCIAGALTAATCSSNSGSLFGGFLGLVSAAGVPLFHVDIILLATVALGALLAP